MNPVSYKQAIAAIEFAARSIDMARNELAILWSEEINKTMASAGVDLNAENMRMYELKRKLEHLAMLVDAADPATSIEVAEITNRGAIE